MTMNNSMQLNAMRMCLQTPSREFSDLSHQFRSANNGRQLLRTNFGWIARGKIASTTCDGKNATRLFGSWTTTIKHRWCQLSLHHFSICSICCRDEIIWWRTFFCVLFTAKWANEKFHRKSAPINVFTATPRWSWKSWKSLWPAKVAKSSHVTTRSARNLSSD